MRPFILSLVALACLTNCAGLLKKVPKTVVIDPGHSPTDPGVTGCKGIDEVVYNDTFSEKLKPALAKHYYVLLTRQPKEESTLKDRIAFSKRNFADLFLSIHHDSAQEKYLKRIKKNSKEGWTSTTPIRGYSIFVSKENHQYKRSVIFAHLLGKELKKLGRSPTLHHAEPIKGENRTLLNKSLGIYQYDELAVLRKNTAPAVLLEVGVIVDPTDEAYVSSSLNQKRLIEAITSAMKRFFYEPPRRASWVMNQPSPHE